MPLFKSFVLGGFECSTFRRRGDHRRLDVIASTGHDRFAETDYRQLVQHGMLSARDGVRWHVIEPQGNGCYDWSSFLPQVRAARNAGVQVVWDLMHYGWPDPIDIWSPAFVESFASFAKAVASVVASESSETPFYCPINEISFFAWAGGDIKYFGPFGEGRGEELKKQLISASIAAIDAIRSVDSRARFVQAEPAINVIPDPTKGPKHRDQAIGHTMAQFQAFDGMAGYIWPELGGRPDCLDIIGINYYFNNQWIHHGSRVDIGDEFYRPFRAILQTVYDRYKRPVIVSETGIEEERRPAWLRYICEETRAALLAGARIEGICLYPVVNHPGWDDDRACQNGLFEAEPGQQGRNVFAPLAEELASQLIQGFETR